MPCQQQLLHVSRHQTKLPLRVLFFFFLRNYSPVLRDQTNNYRWSLPNFNFHILDTKKHPDPRTDVHVPCGCAAPLAMASLALLFRRRSLCPASRRRQLRFASSNSEIAWNLHGTSFRVCAYQFNSKVATIDS